MNERERYWQKLQALRAQLAAEQPRLKIVPKGRRHSGEARVLPMPLRCRECREPMLEGSPTLHGQRGLCGKCAGHAQGTPAPELRPYGHDDAA